MTRIKYTIEVPEEAIQDLHDFAKKHGVEFDPLGHVTATRDSFLSETTAMGEAAGHLIQQINGYLAERNMPDRLKRDHESWTPGETQAFLEFAINDFNWEDDRIQYAWWDGSPAEWEKLREQNHRLFEGEE